MQQHILPLVKNSFLGVRVLGRISEFFYYFSLLIAAKIRPKITFFQKKKNSVHWRVKRRISVTSRLRSITDKLAYTRYSVRLLSCVLRPALPGFSSRISRGLQGGDYNRLLPVVWFKIYSRHDIFLRAQNLPPKFACFEEILEFFWFRSPQFARFVFRFSPMATLFFVSDSNGDKISPLFAFGKFFCPHPRGVLSTLAQKF